MNVDISIVSHGQGTMVSQLLSDASDFGVKCERLIVTKNIPESMMLSGFDVATDIVFLENSHKKGFAANHNAAFVLSNAEFFAVLNPDLRLCSNPFPRLLKNFDDPKVGIVCPVITDICGFADDSTRKFPTLMNLFLKLLRLSDGGVQRAIDMSPTEVDWAAGMFLLIRRKAMLAINGFDPNFFLYYEDVDLCARMRDQGWKIILDPGERVMHLAQRKSRRNLRYMRWHLNSMLRYFTKRFFLHFSKKIINFYWRLN